MTRLRFADALEQQPRTLKQAHTTVRDQLSAAPGGDGRWWTGLRERDLVFAGVGASAAALATPVHVLRIRRHTATRLIGDEAPNPSGHEPPATIAVSQSGRSPETIAALRRADGLKIAVVNQPATPLTDIADTALTLGDLPDSRVSTCAFTATQLAVGLLVDAITAAEHNSAWEGLPQHAAQLLDEAAGPIAEFVMRTDDATAFDLVAAAESLTAAEQTALLLREAPRVPAAAMPTRTYLHGAVDAAGPTAHVLFGARREAVLADELATKQVPVLYVTAGEDRPPNAITVAVPELPPLSRAVLEVIVGQMLARQLAQRRGADPEERAFTRLDTKI